MTAAQLVPRSVTFLEPFVLAGVFGPTEVHLAATLTTADHGAEESVILAAALAARAPLHGSVCIDLATVRTTVVSSLIEPTDLVAVEASTDLDLSAATSTADAAPALDDDLDFVAPVDADPQAPLLDDLAWPEVARWIAELTASPLVDVVDPVTGTPSPRSPTDPLRPLVLDHGRLYLARYWHLERLVGADLVGRASLTTGGSTDPSAGFGSPEAAGERISKLFSLAASNNGSEVDAGQLAAARAITERDLVVISGGPGTGKTTTVAHLLAGLVWALHAESGASGIPARERIALAAPTGKAAARMTEAIRDAIGRLAVHLPGEVVDELETLEAVTIHRLLGTRGAGFWHGPERPLTHDLVIVDEVSMVSLSLMAHLLAAIPARTKVVLVGDPYQLASVEAGTVLGDVVGVGRGGRGGSAAGQTAAPAAIASSVRPLATVHRQKAGSAILELAEAIRSGDVDRTMSLLRTADPGDVRWIDSDAVGGATLPTTHQPAADAASSPTNPASSPGTSFDASSGQPTDHQPTLFDAGLGQAPTDSEHHSEHRREHRQRFDALRSEVQAMALDAVRAAQNGHGQEALEKVSSLKVLCALRRGPMGVDQWNRSVEEHLRTQRAIPRGDWYAGRPTMVTENDYLNQVFNGDVGVAVPSGLAPDGARDAAAFRVVFLRPGENQEVEAVRLDRVATQWAMSIHKSQGSEFAHAVVVLPPPPARILTRELLYTAVTRAKRQLTIVASEAAVAAAVTRPVARASGLGFRLEGPA